VRERGITRRTLVQDPQAHAKQKDWKLNKNTQKKKVSGAPNRFNEIGLKLGRDR